MENKNLTQLFILLPVTSPITYIGWCSLYSHVPRLNKQHVRMRFLQFGQRQMYCWYLYFSVKTLFLLYSVAWMGEVSNMCDIFSLSGI